MAPGATNFKHFPYTVMYEVVDRNVTVFAIAHQRSAQGIGKTAEALRPHRPTDNVGVDRHAAALRRKTYAPAHNLRCNATANPCRTTCYPSRYS
jgi:hypothetical protein